MPERTHATATPRPAVSIGSRRTVPIAARRRRRIETAGRGAALARTRKRGAKVERGHLFRADSRSGRARPIPKSNRVRAHPKAALRPAVASGCCRRAPPPPISKSQTENGGGPRRRPAPATRIGRAPFGARTPTDQSPITQPEMPERTHATATPRPAVSIGSRRTVPIAARRRRRIETAGRGAALARTRKRGAKGGNAATFSEQIQGAVALGRFQNPTECEHIRRLPCGQLLRAAVAEELRHRRSPSPKQKTAAGLAVGQHRRPGLAARRSAPARPRIRARSPSLKCQSAHTPQPPLGQRFRSARAEQSP